MASFSGVSSGGGTPLAGGSSTSFSQLTLPLGMASPSVEMLRVRVPRPWLVGDEAPEWGGNDIVYIEEEQASVPRIKCGSIERLIQRMTSSIYSDTAFRDAFLLTYRKFMEPLSLLDQMRRRFHVPPPSELSPELQPEFQQFLLTVRLKVLAILKKWVEAYYRRDFADDAELRAQLESFLHTDVRALIPTSSESLLRTLERQALAVSERPATGEWGGRADAPLPPLVVGAEAATQKTGCPGGHPVDSQKLGVEDMACQLTVLSFRTYSCIGPNEFLGMAWSQPDRLRRAPGIVRATQEFNAISWWVSSEIIRQLKIKDRVSTVKKFICVSRRCLDLNNLQSVFEIMSGLNSSPVRRLKKTWAEVERDAVVWGMFETLSAVISHDGSFRHYRETLNGLSPPCVPYIGVSLTDLTFIEEGNADTVDGLVNWVKYHMTAQIISLLIMYQDMSYERIQPKPEVLEQLLHPYSVGEEEAYKQSLKIEPRDTSEAIESLLMEEEKLRVEVQELQIRVRVLTEANEALQEKNNTLNALLRRERLQSKYISGGAALTPSPAPASLAHPSPPLVPLPLASALSLPAPTPSAPAPAHTPRDPRARAPSPVPAPDEPPDEPPPSPPPEGQGLGLGLGLAPQKEPPVPGGAKKAAKPPPPPSTMKPPRLSTETRQGGSNGQVGETYPERPTRPDRPPPPPRK